MPPCAMVLLVVVLLGSCGQVSSVDTVRNDEVPQPGSSDAGRPVEVGDAFDHDGDAQDDAPVPRVSVCDGLGLFDPVPLTDAERRCSSHDECVRQEASCCPTCDPNNIIAVRAYYEASTFEECCPPLLAGCPHACEPYEPQRYARCVEGLCVIQAY